jgi:hypothetical protein
MMFLLALLLIVGIWVGIIYLTHDGSGHPPLKGMSNPNLFDHIHDKYFK